MDYYIIKPKSVAVSKILIEGIRALDNTAEIVDNLEDADIVVLQPGWTRSKFAVAERWYAFKELNKPCREGYIYLESYKVHV